MDRELFTGLIFPDFMKEFRTRWLPHGGEENFRSLALSAWLVPKTQRFKLGSPPYCHLTYPLRGTISHLKDDRMRIQLEAGLDDELRTSSRDVKAYEEI